jgi:hypothetical protein
MLAVIILGAAVGLILGAYFKMFALGPAIMPMSNTRFTMSCR